jgi:hypothetical protein
MSPHLGGSAREGTYGRSRPGLRMGGGLGSGRMREELVALRKAQRFTVWGSEMRISSRECNPWR